MKKKIGFVLPGLGMSGGIHIVLKWAGLLARDPRFAPCILIPDHAPKEPVPFLGAEEAGRLEILRFSEAETLRFDFIFATWWETWSDLGRFRTRGRGLFLQALESQFFPHGDPRQARFEEVIFAAPYVLCISNWLRDYIVNFLGYPAGNVACLPNPLDRTMWRPAEPMVPKNEATVRFLIEGPIVDPRKNIMETVEMLGRLGVEYIWVGASVKKNLATGNCVGVFSRVPYRDMPAVYSSCDVLVKLSSAEGMFGPPLEMFSTGGTALCWDVPGSEEYMSHLYNSVLVPMNDMPSVESWVRHLSSHPDMVRRLKANALCTVQSVPSWEQKFDRMAVLMENLPEN